MVEDPDRRGFLKLTTCALGGGLGLAVAGPALRLLGDPADKTTVTVPSDPIDVGAVEQFRIGQPHKVQIVAPRIVDAWTAARDVVLGAAWVRRTAVGDKAIEVFSAVCPHLGCGINYDGASYGCPCHDSKFKLTGERESGPSKRGLDSLSWSVTEGRLRVAWVNYALDQHEKTPG